MYNVVPPPIEVCKLPISELLIIDKSVLEFKHFKHIIAYKKL